MTGESGGGPRDSDARLAPVIPLFGGREARTADASTDASVGSAAKRFPAGQHLGQSETRSSPGSEEATNAAPQRSGDAGLWRSTWDASLPSGRSTESTSDGTPSDRHPANGGGSPKNAPRLRALDGAQDDAESVDGPDPEESRKIAAESLVRKLRARSLSISEARTVLKTHGLDGAQIDDVLDEFTRRGYLDDAALASQLVESGTQRKGQGRVALSRALAQRGIPRDVVNAALDELPDDDAERALDFARTKARSLSRLEPETALRRLVGQLSRRGYNGSVAMTAAKSALAEATFGGRPTGVRFVDSD